MANVIGAAVILCTITVCTGAVLIGLTNIVIVTRAANRKCSAIVTGAGFVGVAHAIVVT